MCIVCVLTWSLLGVKKSLGYAQISLFWGLIQISDEHPPPLSYVGYQHSTSYR